MRLSLNTSGVSVFFKRGLAIGAVIGLVLAADTVQAKTSKYKRHKKAADATDALANPSASPAPAPATGGDQKVDLSNLENRYWTAKDAEFNVVQNRRYTKAHKFSLTPQLGTILNNQYNSTYNFGVALNYYFSERQGVEIQGWKSSSQNSKMVTDFQNQFTTSPNFNVPDGYIGVNYNWVPIYAKMSLLEKRILYFDMSVNPGVGVTFMHMEAFGQAPSLIPPPTTYQAPLTFALDIAQQFFINEHFAIRLDLRNHFFGQTIYNAGNGSPMQYDHTYEATFMLGVTLFQ